MVAATVVIHKAKDMSYQGRRDVAAWLNRQAKDLIKLGPEYATRFKATYRYKED